jgi:hypothetical protein
LNARFHAALSVMQEQALQLSREASALADRVQVLGDLVGDAVGSRSSSDWDLVIEAAKALEHGARHHRPGREFFRELRRGVIQEARRIRAAQNATEVDQ